MPWDLLRGSPDCVREVGRESRSWRGDPGGDFKGTDNLEDFKGTDNLEDFKGTDFKGTDNLWLARITYV